MVSRYVEIKSHFGYNSLRANYIQKREISIVFFQNYIIDIRFRFFTRSKVQFFSIRRNGATIATQDRDTCAVYRALYPPQCERCIYAWGARPNQIYGRHFCVKTLLRSFFVSERRISCSLIINDSKDGKDFPLSTCNLIKNWLMLQQTLHRKLKI